MGEPFDHDRHCRLLEEAEHELRDKPHLAGAVRRAQMIHREFQCRVGSARHAAHQLDRAVDIAHKARRIIDEYVTKAGGPWIGPDLFPESKTPGTEES